MLESPYRGERDSTLNLFRPGRGFNISGLSVSTACAAGLLSAAPDGVKTFNRRNGAFRSYLSASGDLRRTGCERPRLSCAVLTVLLLLAPDGL